MKNQAFLANQYLRYCIKARSIQYIHSPFMFSLMQHTFTDNIPDDCKWIETERRSFKRNKAIIPPLDAGAGSRVRKTALNVSDIAYRSLQPAKYARLLKRISDFLEFQYALELGTSLGITTAYLSTVRSMQSIDTVEGNPAISTLAGDMFVRHNINKINLHTGFFDDILPSLLRNRDTYDIVYIDGNHRYESTMRYVKQILPYSTSHSLIVLDDIHWSPEMQKAWDEIIQSKDFTLTIDIFKMGFLFLNPDLQKQHFILKY